MDKKIRRPAVPEFPSLVCQVFFGYLQGDRKMCKNKVVNAGKTTLITRLLPVLTDYGLKVATDVYKRQIQYVKRNKPNGRVECSISGLPGCIGAEQCKFYLKKNVHK